MRKPAAFIGLVLVLAAGSPRDAGAGEGEGEGIVWQGDLVAGLDRAAHEGRPVLLAVNALESEQANRRLRHELYPSAPWGQATREYVCFVGNPDRHGSGPTCPYYAGIPCEAHQTVLSYLVHRLDPVSGSLISPQHVVLEPDGDVAFRKEYYTGVVSPDLLEALWVRVSPELAYARAGDERSDLLATLEDSSTKDLLEDARAWLRSGDALAAAGLLRAIDFAADDARRRLLIQGLDATPAGQLPVVELLADELGTEPDVRCEDALLLARALLAARRESGVRLLARIAARTEQAETRRRALALWLEDPEARTGTAWRRPEALPDAERAAYVEVLLLTGAPDAPRLEEGEVPEPLRRRLARAERRAGRRTRLAPGLAEALEDGRAGLLRAALLEAGADEVRKQAAAVRRTLRERPEARLRYAAAIALMGAGLDEGGAVAPTVWAAVSDPLEGPEARAEAVRRLGEDPGANEEVWLAAAAKAAGGGK